MRSGALLDDTLVASEVIDVTRHLNACSECAREACFERAKRHLEKAFTGALRANQVIDRENSNGSPRKQR